ncbi:hypothetical protein E2C01_006276 [Portunus trituberculatus]|uniref:Uncharacterized protein n=1 Tax=Portunus trituberculatus TaxID=210409 RepID=A0A5B7CUN4_PORTR|nr:hypothetical protein [Portunus trituberculatus]
MAGWAKSKGNSNNSAGRRGITITKSISQFVNVHRSCKEQIIPYSAYTLTHGTALMCFTGGRPPKSSSRGTSTDVRYFGE